MLDFAKRGARRWMCATVVIVAALMSFVSCGAADDDWDAVLEQFRKEAPSAWEEHRQLTALVGGTWTTVIHYSAEAGGKPREDIIREEVKLGAGAGVAIHSSDSNMDGKFTFYAVGYNPRYAFSVKSDNAEGPWMLQNLAMNTGQPAWDQIREMLTPPNFMLTAIGGRSIPLNDYVQDDGTRIELQRVEGDLVTFVFHREESRDEKRARWPTEAEVTLNRAQKWTIKRWRAVFPNGHVSEKDIEARIVDDVPILQRSVARDLRSHSATEAVAEGVEEFGFQYPAPPIPMSEFTLSAFGLPEPPDRSGSRWFIYAGSAGILLLAFGFWLRSRRKA